MGKFWGYPGLHPYKVGIGTHLQCWACGQKSIYFATVPTFKDKGEIDKGWNIKSCCLIYEISVFQVEVEEIMFIYFSITVWFVK
jgi:hypothetical protein